MAGRIMKRHCVIAFALTVIACVGGWGCGGSQSTARGSREGNSNRAPVPVADSNLSAGVVASFAGRQITEATLDHWVAVEAATIYEDIPKRAVPSGVVPDPPEFRACIAYLRSVDAAQEPPHPTTNSKLFAECRTNYQKLRAHALTILISFDWLENEAKSLGIHVVQSRIVSEFKRFRGEVFGSLANYQRFLRRTGQTLADEYLRMRMDLNTRALTKHFTSEGAAAFIRYSRQLPKEWASETTCRAPDVVPNCREYEGNSEPEAIL